MKTIARLLCFAVAASFLAGCLESDQQTVVMPDGSGKIVWTIGVQMKEGDKEEPLKQDKVSEMEQAAEGIVAWAEPKVTKENGWYKVTLVAYFDDISKVKLFQDKGGEKKEMLSFVYVKNGDGGTLTLKDATLDDAAKDQEEKKEEEPQSEEAKKFAEEMKKQMKEMLKGMKISSGVKVPGSVTASEKFTKTEGRVASVVLDEKLLLDAMDEKPEAKKAIKEMAGEHKVTWTKNETTAEEVEGFKKEMAAAKAAWEKKKAAEGK